MKRVITTFAVGEKYGRLLEECRPALEVLAEREGAEFYPIKAKLVGSDHRPVQAQKLLIPEAFRDYDMLAFVDVDVWINTSCPSIFETLENSRAEFAAVLQPLGSIGYKLCASIIWGRPEFHATTCESYFRGQGFDYGLGLLGPVNGGVWTCRPSAVADEFKAAYYEKDSPSRVNNEEPYFSYLTQRRSVFAAMDPRWNRQVPLEVCSYPSNLLVRQPRRSLFRYCRYAVKRLASRQPNLASRLELKLWGGRRYMDFLTEAFTSNYVLHFSGGAPMPSCARVTGAFAQ